MANGPSACDAALHWACAPLMMRMHMVNRVIGRCLGHPPPRRAGLRLISLIHCTAGRFPSHIYVPNPPPRPPPPRPPPPRPNRNQTRRSGLLQRGPLNFCTPGNFPTTTTTRGRIRHVAPCTVAPAARGGTARGPAAAAGSPSAAPSAIPPPHLSSNETTYSG